MFLFLVGVLSEIINSRISILRFGKSYYPPTLVSPVLVENKHEPLSQSGSPFTPAFDIDKSLVPLNPRNIGIEHPLEYSGILGEDWRRGIRLEPNRPHGLG